MNSAEQSNSFIKEEFPVYNEPIPIYNPNKHPYATPQSSWESSKQPSVNENWTQARDIFSSPVPNYPSPPDGRFDAWGSELINDNRSSFFTEDASHLWNVHPQPIIYQNPEEGFIPHSMIPHWNLNQSYYNPLETTIPFTHPFEFNNRMDLMIPAQFSEPANLESSLDQSLPRNFSQILDRPVKKIRKSKTLDTQSIVASQDNTKPCPGFKCEFAGCGKTFTRPYNLKAHSRIHTQERPFACHICHYAFSRLHDMKRHMNLHSGIKPFQCPHCAKTFARLDALNRHIKKDASTCSSVSRSKFNRTNTL